MRAWHWASALVLFLVPPATAQPERYELGRRLRNFEATWEKFERPAARERALELLPKLTTQFFAGQLGGAGRTLDLAAFALTTDVGPSAGRQWVWSLYAAPAARIVDGAAKEITVTVQPFYPVKGDPPKALELQLWFTNKDVVTVRPDKFPLTVKVPLPPLGDSRGLDRKLYFLADGAKELRPSAVGISQVADFKDRLAVVKKAADAWEKLETIEQATVRDRARKLADLAERPADTDVPAAGLLANAEQMLDGKPFFTAARSGEFWLSVPLGGKKTAACRVFVPRKLDKTKPVPVVFALHGLGVGADAFFEAYGAGQIVKECEKRGWVLVAPDGGLGLGGEPPVPAIFDKLAERYPLDAKRVFLVGHSLGAGQAVGLAGANPGKFAGLAALGGGGKADVKALAELPVFVGVGDKDQIGLAGARALSKALAGGGAKAVTYKEYAGVEHLVIVREALPDAFAAFDTVAGK